MGLVRVISVSSYDTPGVLPNPNPLRFSIKTGLMYGNYTLVKVNYPDCTNYEGNKILLYKGVDLKTLKKQKYLDPHFSNNENFFSPIARFEPTEFGWDCGCKLMLSLGKEE